MILASLVTEIVAIVPPTAEARRRNNEAALLSAITCDIIGLMKQVLTIVCKLNPSEEVIKKIDNTLEMFAGACNYANEKVKPTITSKTTIQSLAYQAIREKFDLSANLAVRACARVGANRKTAKKKNKPVKEFKPTSADYDARIFAFREKDWSVSLTLVGGRERIPIIYGNYQKGKLKGKKPTSAQLCKHYEQRLWLAWRRRFKCKL